MATNNPNSQYVSDKDGYGQNGQNGSPLTNRMTREEHEAATSAARFGYGPLAHVQTGEGYNAAFGGEFQPGTFRSVSERKFANPAPLGLCAFALTTFVLSLINLNTRGIATPSIVIGSAFGYGGFIQLLAGMWYVKHSPTSMSELAPSNLDTGKWLSATHSVQLLSRPTVVSGSLLA